MSSQSDTGVYNATTQSIDYAVLGLSVSVLNGTVTSDTSGFAYVSNQNVFSAPQVFTKNVSFTSLVLFPYYENTVNTSAFDASNGSKQKFSFNDSGSHTLSFANLRAGGNYVFVINVTGGSATLVKATTFTDCDTIAAMYKYGSTTYPLTLAVGVHTFIAEAFTTAIHVQYIGTSVAA